MFKSAPKGSWTGPKPQRNDKPYEDNNKRKLFVAGIGSDAREEDIRDLFKDYDIDSVFMKQEGEPRAHCFVTFGTEAEMQEVFSNASKFSLNGRPVNIRHATPRPENGLSAGRRPGLSTSGDTASGGTAPSHATRDQNQNEGKPNELFLGGLPKDMTEEDIHRLFDPFGVDKVVLVKPQNSAKKPFAFVTLREAAAVAQAVNQMNNYQFLGRKICVSPSNKTSATNATTGGMMAPGAAPWGQAPPSSEHASVGAGFSDRPPTEQRPSDVPPPLLESIPDAPADAGFTIDGPPPLEDRTDEASSTSSEPAGPGVLQVQTPGVDEGCHEVYVGNLKNGITHAELSAMFDKYGVVNVSLKFNKGSNIYGFVELASEEGVQAAIRDLHGALNADGKPMVIRKSNPAAKNKPYVAKARAANSAITPPASVPGPGFPSGSMFLDNKNKIYVANLPHGVAKEEVRELFSKYQPKEVLLVTKGFHPYAFITMSSRTAFESAMQEMQGLDYKGSKLFLGLPRPKEIQTNEEVAVKSLKGAPHKESQAAFVVFNFPFKATRDDILKLLSPWKPSEVRMGEVQHTPGSYTHAHVTVRSWEVAMDAYFLLDTTCFWGRPLGVAVLGNGGLDQH